MYKIGDKVKVKGYEDIYTILKVDICSYIVKYCIQGSIGNPFFINPDEILIFNK